MLKSDKAQVWDKSLAQSAAAALSRARFDFVFKLIKRCKIFDQLWYSSPDLWASIANSF